MWCLFLMKYYIPPFPCHFGMSLCAEVLTLKERTNCQYIFAENKSQNLKMSGLANTCLYGRNSHLYVVVYIFARYVCSIHTFFFLGIHAVFTFIFFGATAFFFHFGDLK